MTEEQKVRAIALECAVKAIPTLEGRWRNDSYMIMELASQFESYIKEGWEIIHE